MPFTFSVQKHTEIPLQICRKCALHQRVLNVELKSNQSEVLPSIDVEDGDFDQIRFAAHYLYVCKNFDNSCLLQMKF